MNTRSKIFISAIEIIAILSATVAFVLKVSVQFLTLVLSVVVTSTAAATAYLTYLNFRVVTDANLYINAETKGAFLGIDNYLDFPTMIRESLLRSGQAVPGAEPVGVRWYDIYVGNAGPGLAKVVKWTINYDTRIQETMEASTGTPFLLGPQTRMQITRYIPRDYLPSKSNTRHNSFTKPITSSGAYPWTVTVYYVKGNYERGRTVFKTSLDIYEQGMTRQHLPEVFYE